MFDDLLNDFVVFLNKRRRFIFEAPSFV